MICNCAFPSREIWVSCVWSEDDDKPSKFSDAIGDGLSALDVVGDDPSDPDMDDRLSGELW